MHSLNWVRHIFSAMFGVRTSLKWPQCQRFLCSKPSDIEVAQLEFVQTKQQRSNHVRYSDTKIDWDAEMCEVFGEEREQNNARSVLAPVNDESKFYAEPMLRPTYHLAAYVNKSATLQRLIRLGVNLDYLERRKMAQLVAQLDFDRDVKEHVRFLTRVVGLEIDEIGLFLTKNPHILEQSLDDLQTRVNYLRAKKFQPQDITRIIRLNRRWLNHSTKEIDARLASFQIMFELSGDEVRAMAIAGPKVITEQQQQIREASFSLKEECCFEADEAKDILLKCPSVWMLPRQTLMENYDYINHNMGLDNAQLAKTPFILIARLFRIKERHGFLKKIGRAQYDPHKPLYVCPDQLCVGVDEEFALNIAKRPVDEFHGYLRTL